MSSKKSVIAIILALVLIGGGYFVYRNMFDWIRIKAEQVASESLGVEVDIASINASFKNKTVTIKGITIANPKGFSSTHAVRFGLVEVQADTLSREKVVIKKVLVSDNDINLEVEGTRTNLSALSNGIKGGNAPSSSESKSPTLNIRELIIDKTTLNFSSGMIGSKGTVPMTKIRMQNIGQDNNQAKVVVAQIANAVINSALGAAMKSGAMRELTNAGNEVVKENMKKGTDKLKKALGDIKFK